MKRNTKVACGLLLGAVALSCAGAPRMIGSWTDPTYQTAPVQKVLVIGLGENEARVRAFETAMADQMKKRGIQTVLGSSIIPVGAPFDTTGGRKYCRDNGIELVTITRLLGLSRETEYVPGTTYVEPVPTYHHLYPFYYSAYAVVSTPGYVRQYPVATVETNVYSTKDERLVWSGQSEAVDPTSALEAAEGFAAIFVKKMDTSGILGTKSQGRVGQDGDTPRGVPRASRPCRDRCCRTKKGGRSTASRACPIPAYSQTAGCNRCRRGRRP